MLNVKAPIFLIKLVSRVVVVAAIPWRDNLSDRAEANKSPFSRLVSNCKDTLTTCFLRSVARFCMIISLATARVIKPLSTKVGGQ